MSKLMAKVRAGGKITGAARKQLSLNAAKARRAKKRAKK
jgi:hypothetical protein